MHSHERMLPRRSACQPAFCTMLLYGCTTVLSSAKAVIIWLVLTKRASVRRVRKTIINFPDWSTKNAPQSNAETAFDVLTSVYAVCNASSGALVHTVTAPKLSRTGIYKVELQLCGPPARPRTAEVTCCALDVDP
jgi:hypothetical protein